MAKPRQFMESVRGMRESSPFQNILLEKKNWTTSATNISTVLKKCENSKSQKKFVEIKIKTDCW